ncbi:cobyrinic acid a,c-diamide synthase [Micromonospora phaseoli]|uniref:Cobyrinic acid a,c-diamide synthase n=2 Tax=Micromonospora phaseoli TaxID=1144548 RepID=A0A1H6WG22_9ACTN|nr:cobyrinate a,c-diamide synthase [Micromonospora phaseoli]PZW01641.1 cobyrinic acid a,c-diamide synthase [Micromonospora phaseoli]GIJ80668.1 hydrogenobyrinate a,c-diamide synthase [Micromonospora phaseoli]SEJ11740.1 cobyrinic acid a,c-diamide synthase [Micromonospora phaseoli]
MTVVPRLVLSAPSSGHGKNALAIGLLAAFADRGVDVAGFKIGPDQVDAAYLGLAAGRPGRTLDPRLVGTERLGPLLLHGAAGTGLAVVQGSMGLYDSLTGRSETESTAAVATALRSPVVLVVDVAAMGQSVAALVHGFRAYDEQLWIGGVILNRVASSRHETLLREALDDIGIPVYGALRRQDLPSVLPSRRHGVMPVLEATDDAARAVRRLGEAVTATVDLERLIGLARSAPPLGVQPWSPAGDPPLPAGAAPPVVAVAGGPGGSFSHAETVELLRAAGAEVATVDPFADEVLPAGTRALVIGGALPESYAEQLSANRRLCIAVAELARTGRPVIGEGAGLLWLARELDGLPMCGVIDAIGSSRDGLVVGYREATAQGDSVVAARGEVVTGHKEHRAVLTPRGGPRPAWSWPGGSPEGFIWRGVHASQLVPHWAAYPGIASRLVAAASAEPATVPAGDGGAAPADPAAVAPASPAGVAGFGPAGGPSA